MRTRTCAKGIKALAVMIIAALMITFVPALAFPASAAVKYKTTSVSNYKVKLPSGKSWTKDSQTIDLSSLDTSQVPASAGELPDKISYASSTKETKNGVRVVSFAGMKSKQKITLSDLKATGKALNSTDLASLVNELFNSDETYSSLGTLAVKSIKASTVSVKKYKKALKLTIKGNFTGSGYKVSADMTVYVTVKNNNVLSVCAAKATLSDDGTLKITSGSSEKSMAKKVLQSVKIK